MVRSDAKNGTGIYEGLVDLLLECRNITFRYPSSTSEVFNQLSFRMDEPGFNALFGPSGVGKTSLARIIVGDINEYYLMTYCIYIR